MADKLLSLIKSNRPEDLNEKTDYLNTIPKGNMIIDFLNNVSTNPEAKIQVIGLFSPWGSGKTSLMKWIDNNINRDNFYPIFFESWLHEKDDNIALSLIDVIGNNIEIGVKQITKEVYTALGYLLKGVAKSITIDAKIAKFNIEKIIQEGEKFLENEPTYYEKITKFKKEYIKLEDAILDGKNQKKLLIFIDDLDRCEPENVLSLLSAIKLFFTYGERSIFILGLDKDALQKAVYHKYKDVIKADEYLEKIFDISFDMPKINILKMVHHYFGESSDSKKIYAFLNAINFTNPRHLKKVLNKYLLLEYYQRENIANIKLIPNLEVCFFKIIVLIIIIIYEFERDTFEFIKNYDDKLSNYASNLADLGKSSEPSPLSTVKSILIDNVATLNIKQMRYQEKFTSNYGTEEGEYIKLLRFTSAFVTIFSPKVANYLPLQPKNHYNYSKQFCKERSYSALFCSYLYDNADIIPNEDESYILYDIFEMAETYL